MLRYLPLLFLFFVLGCSENPQTDSSPASAHGDYSLVFFLDPNGGPCRMQDKILRGMSEELQDAVDLRYVQTTVPSDLDTFYKFGIRALPTLLLADASGKEIGRLPPGVKSAEEIRGFLRAVR